MVAAVAVAVSGVPGGWSDAGSPAASAAGPSGRAATATQAATGLPATARTDTTLMGPAGPVLGGARSLRELVGMSVTGRAAQVLAVPADEGFWVGNGDERVWVQLPAQAGAESAVQIRPGQRLSFAATVVAHDAAFARTVGLTADEGAVALTAQGAHLAVAPGTLTVTK